jgi:hypothetical protein
VILNYYSSFLDLGDRLVRNRAFCVACASVSVQLRCAAFAESLQSFRPSYQTALALFLADFERTVSGLDLARATPHERGQHF